MKKIFTVAIVAAMSTVAATAQYFSTKEYQNLSYTLTPDKGQAEMTVVSVDKADNGNINVVLECFAKGPDFEMLGGQFTYPLYGSYDAETEISKYTFVTGEYMKKFILGMVKAGMQEAITTEEEAEQFQQAMAQVEASMVVRGQIDITLDPKAKPGDKMPDSNLSVELGAMNMAMNLWNGKYLGLETVTVEAGTFDCIKVEYTIRTKNSGVITKKRVTEWYAKGVGPVKSISVEESTGTESFEELKSID